jgi:phosphoserine phosphatase RsbU/P
VSTDPVTARFPAQRASVAAARQFVTDALVEAGVTSVLDDSRLLVSELATNAVVHANTDFSVTVHISAGRVYVEVRDGDPTELDLTADQDLPELAISGQGLRIVGRLAGSWGSRVEDHGKVIWFSVDA